MLTDEEIDSIGFALEEEGLSHSEIDEYFAHYGVKGMRWGVRRTKNLQKNVLDPMRRTASGTGSKTDKINTAMRLDLQNIAKGRGVKGGAQLQLDKAQRYQKDIAVGKRATRNALAKASGFNIKDLDYSYSKSSSASKSTVSKSNPQKSKRDIARAQARKKAGKAAVQGALFGAGVGAVWAASLYAMRG